jgi:Ca2+-binding EF-hand superfamily protein
MMQMGLARGWSAWEEQWSDAVHKRNLLKGAASRLMKPKMVAAFSHWQRDWVAVETAKTKMTEAERRAAADAENAADWHQMQNEILSLRAELEKAKKAALAGSSLEADLQRQMEQEREKRVAHLQQLGVKRMMQIGLARGWSAWEDQWREAVHKRNLLKGAASRLTKPKMVAAFMHWQRDWEHLEMQRAAMSGVERLEADARRKAKEQAEVYAEVSRLRLELADARKAMADGRGLEAQMEEEREKRVAHLAQLGLKRMMQMGLARGWSAWEEQWRDAVHKRNLLKGAAMRLTKPKMVAAFTHWQRDWVAVEMSKAQNKEYERLAAAQAQNEAGWNQMQNEILTLRAELEYARTAMAEGRGQEAELQRQMEREREKRVLHLQQLGLKRMMQMGLARGWTAWHDQYEEFTYKKRLLQHAGSRLRRPRLVASFVHWQNDWEAAYASRFKSDKQLLVEERDLRTSLEASVQRLEYELAAARKAAKEGTGQQAEMQRQMALKLQEEKDKRVADLQMNAIRRISQLHLSRGWNAWSEQYHERVRMMRLLKGAGTRMAKPQLGFAFGHWKRVSAAEKAVRQTMSFQERLNVESARYDTMEASMRGEIQQLKLELIAARDALLNESGKEEELKRKMEQQLDKEREKRVAHLAQLGVKRLMQQGLARGWSAWEEQWSDAVHKRNLLKGAASRLMKPKMVAAFMHWQRDWDADEADRKAEAAARAAMTTEEIMSSERLKRVALEDQILKLEADLQAAREAMRAGSGMEQDLKRQIDEEREKRVAHLQQVGMRRLLNAKLAKGWTTWLNMYLERKRALELLREAARRLVWPKLVAALRTWQEMRRRARNKKDRANTRKRDADDQSKLVTMDSELKRLRAESEQNSSLHRVALAEARQALSDALGRLSNEKSAADEARSAARDALDSVRQSNQAAARASELVQSQQDQAASQLAKLLADQRAQLTAELMKLREEKDKEIARLLALLQGMEQPKPPPEKPKPPPEKPTPPKKPDPWSLTEKKKPKTRMKPSLLAALASSMGVNPVLVADAVEEQASGKKQDFDTIMRKRATEFGAADLDFDGKLDFNEYCIMVRNRETTEYTETQLREKFNALDLDGSGKIDQYEFITFSLRDAFKRSKGKALDMFRIWDEDNSGFVDFKEFQKVLVGLGFCCGKEDMRQVFDFIDGDGSGQIEYNEIQAMLRPGPGAGSSGAAAAAYMAKATATNAKPAGAAKPPGAPKGAKAPAPSPRATKLQGQ